MQFPLIMVDVKYAIKCTSLPVTDGGCLPRAQNLVGVVQMWAGVDQLGASMDRAVDQWAAVHLVVMHFGMSGDRVDHGRLVDDWSMMDDRLHVVDRRQDGLDNGLAMVVRAALMRHGGRNMVDDGSNLSVFRDDRLDGNYVRRFIDHGHLMVGVGIVMVHAGSSSSDGNQGRQHQL